MPPDFCPSATGIGSICRPISVPRQLQTPPIFSTQQRTHCPRSLTAPELSIMTRIGRIAWIGSGAHQATADFLSIFAAARRKPLRPGRRGKR